MAVNEKEDAGALKVETEQIENTAASSHDSNEVKNEVAKSYGVEEADFKVTFKLVLSLICMMFLWVGSQIPLYLFGSVLPDIYVDIGGVDRHVWFVIGYLIPNAALCPFVGALSDIFGRQYVAIVGQAVLIIGPIITATANSMNVAIAGQVFSGLGAGLNELVALAGTAEMVPASKRGIYVGLVVFSILPFCPSVVYAKMIAESSNWRFNGILIGVWNFIGLILCIFCYHDPPRISADYTAREIVSKIDYVGGFLSIMGVLLFMMGMQWGAEQYEWNSTHVLPPLILGIILILAFFVWEFKFAKWPMVPAAMFKKSKRNMIIILILTFVSGGNFFVLLLFYPTQIYNVYGNDPVGIGLRSLPIGFGIIGGAVISLLLIPVTKGRITELMIFFTAMMTAGTGAMSVSTPDNLGLTCFIVTLASIGVGGVIIPCSIIAQLVCPDELIATVTAITLSIRYIGGAIAYTIFYTVFYNKFEGYATDLVGFNTIIMGGYIPPQYLDFITEVVTMLANARFEEVQALLAESPYVTREGAYEAIVAAMQDAFALGYRWPYWMSIAFGSFCFFCSFGLKNIRQYLDPHVAAPQTKV